MTRARWIVAIINVACVAFVGTVLGYAAARLLINGWAGL